MAYRKTSGTPGSTSKFAPEIKTQQQAEQEAQELLASFGSRILEMLKAGGNKLEGMDNRYAESIYQRFGNGKGLSPAINAGSNTPIMDLLRQDAGGVPALMAQKYGGVAANVASRYALPAGGVMLAGKGLADLTNGLYDVASDTPIL